MDAELLLAHVLGVPRRRLLTAGRRRRRAAARFAELVDRRGRREPLQHLTGSRAFRHLELAVGPGRVHAAPGDRAAGRLGVDRLRRLAEPFVVDLCAGSGALALAVAHESPGARVSPSSATPARWSGPGATPPRGRPPATPRSRCSAGDMADPGCCRELDGTVDVVVSNPPYVPDGARRAARGRRPRPAAALFGGPDGLASSRPWSPRPGCCGPAAGSASSTTTRRASACPRCSAARVLDDVADHVDLAGRPAVRHRPSLGGRPAGSDRLLAVADVYDCTDPEPAPGRIDAAGAASRRGELVVLPTDTVYGIGADAFTPAAVTGLLEAKGRGRTCRCRCWSAGLVRWPGWW